jgi:hypothetical protein
LEFQYDEIFRPVQSGSGARWILALTPIHMSASRQFVSHRDHKQAERIFSSLALSHLHRRSLQIYFFVLGSILGLLGCAGKAAHDEALAAKRAVEFAETVFVQNDIEKGYRLLSDGARRHVPLEKFKETVTRMHPNGYPTSVTAREFEPMPGGEKAIYIFLTGDGSGDRFDYKLTLEGSAATDYRVTNLEPGTSSHFLMEHRKAPLKK